MKWLIRRVLKKSKGAVQYEEKVWQGDGLTIGRATDQAIFLSDLRAALRHVVVTRAAQGKYKIESLMLAGIRVDGELTYSTLAGPGSVIEIGDTRIQLLTAPRGYDGAVEMTTLGKDEADAKSARLKPMRLTQTWLRKRPLSWLLFVGIFLFGLILPMFGYFKPEVGKRLEHAFLPSAVSWIPGTMTASHQFIESDCGRCHQTPFRAVRDEACTACHSKTAAHFDAAKFRETGLGNDACRACHQDHQGREGLVRRDQRLCANCHRDLKERVGALAASEDVSDFGTAHPEFELNLPDWNDQGEFVPLPTVFAKDLRENSGLKFNHAKHLAADGLKAPKGQRVLDCADCHAPEPGGARMRPVRFETMCHECHTLGFDALAPQREVPHGKVSEVVYMLGEYYAKFALEGGYLDAKAPTIVQQRRRPGSPPLARQDRAEALTWARDQTAKVTQSLFVDRACTTCHKVTAPDADNPQWRVAPVRVAGAWYLGAKFSHAKHNTAKCEDCHGARDSKEAADLLIPGIDNCRGCHAGAYARDKVPSTCITCHDYHPQAAQTKR
jgi:predicted CXXCH cytochrome family protein